MNLDCPLFSRKEKVWVVLDTLTDGSCILLPEPLLLSCQLLASESVPVVNIGFGTCVRLSHYSQHRQPQPKVELAPSRTQNVARDREKGGILELQLFRRPVVPLVHQFLNLYLGALIIRGSWA